MCNARQAGSRHGRSLAVNERVTQPQYHECNSFKEKSFQKVAQTSFVQGSAAEMSFTKWRLATCTFFQIVMPKSRPVAFFIIAALVHGFVAYFPGAARAFGASAGGVGHCFNFSPRDARRPGQKICANNQTKRRWPSVSTTPKICVQAVQKSHCFRLLGLLCLFFFFLSLFT